MKQSDLKHVYSRVPKGFHDALHHAAHSVEEEKSVKRMSTLVLACILMLALACGTALAIANYYSVRQYQAGDEPSATFEKYMSELNQTFENEYISFTLTDAVFDGESIALAMNILAKDPDKPVYLYPQLSAACNGRQLELDIEGMRGDFTSGFMLAAQADQDELGGEYGFDAAVLEARADGDVTWKFSMQVLVPNWPVENEDSMLIGEETAMEFDDFLQRFRDAYEQERILTTRGESLVEYAAVLPVPEGMEGDEFHKMRLGDQLVQSGAFTLADTIVCEFDTVLPQERWQGVGAGLSFPMDEYTVEFLGMDLSFMRAAYSFDLVFPDKTTVEELEASADKPFNYTLYDQDGKALSSGGYSSETPLKREDGTVALRYTGVAGFSQEIPVEIRFVPGLYTQAEWKADEARAFTVPIMEMKPNTQ